MAEANLNSLYIPGLMDPEDYAEISKDYAKQTVLNLLQVPVIFLQCNIIVYKVAI